MNSRQAAQIALMSSLLLAASVAVHAQEPGDEGSGGPNLDGPNLDLTMTLMPEGATTPEAVTKVIALPARAAVEATSRSADGVKRANEARANRELGLETADQAQEGAREFGQAVRELAQENREDLGRGEPPETVPPEVPGPPDTPGPPQN